MKRRIRLTESDIHRIIKESTKRILKENSRDIDDDNYFGGGLPDSYFDDDDFENDRISNNQIKQLEKIAQYIADIANNSNDDTNLLFKAVECIDKFTQLYR